MSTVLVIATTTYPLWGEGIRFLAVKELPSELLRVAECRGTMRTIPKMPPPVPMRQCVIAADGGPVTLRVGRRPFLQRLGATGVVLWVGGCGYYSPAEGVAYAPWQFPATSDDALLQLVHAATLAANPHNTQPWLFRLTPGWISLHADASRSLGAMDPLGRELIIGLGCALENLTIAARHGGMQPVVHYESDPEAPAQVARVDLFPGAAEPQPLFPALARRRTHRGAYASRALERRQLDLLTVEEGSVRVHWLVSPAEQEAFRTLTIEATQAIIEDREMSEASFRWYRQDKKEIEAYRDGLTVDAQALGGLTTILAKIAGRTSRETVDRYWLENTRNVHCKQVSAFGILSTPALEDRALLLQAGRAYQRMHLTATAQGLSMQPLNQAAERRDMEHERNLDARFGARLAALVGQGRHAQMLFRIGYGKGEVFHSPRRDPADTILKGNR